MRSKKWSSNYDGLRLVKKREVPLNLGGRRARAIEFKCHSLGGQASWLQSAAGTNWPGHMTSDKQTAAAAAAAVAATSAQDELKLCVYVYLPDAQTGS